MFYPRVKQNIITLIQRLSTKSMRMIHVLKICVILHRFFRTRDRLVIIGWLVRKTVCLSIFGNASIAGPEGVS